MDHVVYVDVKAKEMEKIISKEKTMIIRGAAGRKLPYGRVNPGDKLYLINNNAEGECKAAVKVKSVLNSEKMDKDTSIKMVEDNQEKLQLSDQQFKRWAGKRYLVLIEIFEAESIDPIKIDKSAYGNMDDWLPVEDINSVIVNS